MEILKDKRLKNLGYSGRNLHEDDQVDISIGSTSSYNGGVRYRAAWIFLKSIDLRVTAGPEDVHRLIDAPREARGIVGMEIIMEVLTPSILMEIIETAKDDGRRDGRTQLQKEIRGLLNI